MNRKKLGMTLVETSLSIALSGIIMIGLFNFLQNKQILMKRMQQNACAVYALESMRNFVKNELDRGIQIDEITNEGLQLLIDREMWNVSLELKDGESGEALVISLQFRDKNIANCFYVTEVFSR